MSGKKETKFWKLVKQRTPKIRWNRIENSVSQGFPDLIGSAENSHFFSVELKVANDKGIVSFSPHQIAWHRVNHGSKFILVQTLFPLSVKLFQSSFACRPRVKLTDHDPLFVVRDTHDPEQWTTLQEHLIK
tara:strand:+ start:113 stop:505 length:393 start_codon:yes stop_codon:yes gene_type:complete